MLQAGINVCLGCDGGPSNNAYDMFREMYLAAIIHKARTLNPLTMPAETVLEMATINGARALGLADQISSIEVGKKADLIALDLGSLNTQPLYDPVAQIVYAASSRQVSHVWIDGVAQLRDSEFCHLDNDELIATASAWANKIKS